MVYCSACRGLARRCQALRCMSLAVLKRDAENPGPQVDALWRSCSRAFQHLMKASWAASLASSRLPRTKMSVLISSSFSSLKVRTSRSSDVSCPLRDTPAHWSRLHRAWPYFTGKDEAAAGMVWQAVRIFSFETRYPCHCPKYLPKAKGESANKGTANARKRFHSGSRESGAFIAAADKLSRHRPGSSGNPSGSARRRRCSMSSSARDPPQVCLLCAGRHETGPRSLASSAPGLYTTTAGGNSSDCCRTRKFCAMNGPRISF